MLALVSGQNKHTYGGANEHLDTLNFSKLALKYFGCTTSSPPPRLAEDKELLALASGLAKTVADDDE